MSMDIVCKKNDMFSGLQEWISVGQCIHICVSTGQLFVEIGEALKAKHITNGQFDVRQCSVWWPNWQVVQEDLPWWRLCLLWLGRKAVVDGDADQG